jgi:acyl-CoA reductase-like NAD-dependent aldehyde dehydrogenase
MQDLAVLINGRLVPGASTMPVINPSTGAPFAQAPAASEEQLDEAVRAAGRAFATWRTTPFEERRAILLKIADTIEAHREDLAWLLTRENGKPLAAARVEIQSTVEYTRYFATLSLDDELIENSSVRRVEIQRIPLGVVAVIVPWNFPLLLLAFKLPAALLAGNTVVVKPAPSTPLATLLLARLLVDIVPPGVVNVVSGTDALGPWLTAHPGIRKVSFTGSTETGKKVMAGCAENLTRLTLELGGNDPAIVLEDVDVEATAASIFASAFGNCGQVCRAVKRVYVHASIYEAFCTALAQRAQRAVVGDGSENPVDYGPVHSQAQYRRLQALLEDARGRGVVMEGGGVVEGPGYFLRPTIVKDIDPDSRLVLEEQFGPILPVLSFDDLERTIADANNGPYGLAASVWSRDLGRARAVAARLDAGTVWINKHIDRTPHLPVAGAKHSGIGVELGLPGLHEFTQIKVVNQSAAA